MAKLYVGNLSHEATDESLQQLFVAGGFKVESARVIRDMNSGQPRGFGFVELGPNEDAAKAISQLHGTDMHGRAVQVNEARPRAPRGGSRDRHAGGGNRY
jgi:RNA recognition motif-containing protein